MSPGDRQARRDTPLALRIKARLRETGGEMALAEFVEACLWDEAHGYYATRPVVGVSGDFITAPEISQVFGELLGLWSAVVWQQMGSPADAELIELGPGRGTLMADALRAARRVPGFPEALAVTLVERSPSLRAVQRQRLSGGDYKGGDFKDRDFKIAWQDELGLASRPAIVLANEFIDVLGLDQAVLTAQGWRARAVVLDADGQFQFAPSADIAPAAARDLAATWPDAADGAVADLLAIAPLAATLARRAADQPFAALFVDYGHAEAGLGDTLQAVRGHAYEHPLRSPGEADLTMQVDFSAVAREMSAVGFAIDGPVTQAEFLGALGIIERASRLMAANPSRAGEIEAGIARLMAPAGMGTRFKVIGVRSPGLPPLPGFPTSATERGARAPA